MNKNLYENILKKSVIFLELTKKEQNEYLKKNI